MALNESIVMAQGTLTQSGAIADAETVTIGGKVYTFQATLTDVDGNVALGVDDPGSLSNLAAAIMLSNDGESAVGPGNDYAASMTRNPAVSVISFDATTIVVGCPGALGNLVDTTESGLNLAWGGATLAGGSGSLPQALAELISLNQVNSEVIQELAALTPESD